MASGTGRTGYNITKIQELMNNIKSAYESLGKTIETDWTNVQNVLKTNWVGEDEQEYELNLADKICKLYSSAYSMSADTIGLVYHLAKSWHEFQQSNKLENSVQSVTGSFTLEEVTVTQNDKIVSGKTETIAPGANRGLVTESSASSITSALSDYKNNLQSEAKKLIESIEVNSAFFGDQSKQIKSFMEKFGESMGIVVTAIKDFDEVLEKLTNTSYGSASDAAVDAVKTNADLIDNDLSGLKGRWG